MEATTEKKEHDHDDDCHEHHHRHHHHHHEHHEHHEKRHEHRTSHHINELETTIKTLGDALAHLGRGEHLHELLRLIHRPGWTTPAELAFVVVILDHISVEVRKLERLQADLVEASRKVEVHHKCC